MRELLDSFLANGLADFEGLQISGTVPVKTDLINAIIADFLKPEDTDSAVTEAPVEETVAVPAPAEIEPVVTAPTPAAKPKKVSLQKVIRPLIKHVAIKAVDGKIVLEFEVRR